LLQQLRLQFRIVTLASAQFARLPTSPPGLWSLWGRNSIAPAIPRTPYGFQDEIVQLMRANPPLNEPSSAIIVEGDKIMRRTFTAVVIFAAMAFSAAAQDWYHDREERFRGEGWRSHLFTHVRTDLDHIWSADRAAERERKRLETTKQELTKMQTDLDQGRWDNNILNDVIDSIRKSSNDERLAQRDRAVLADDLVRLKEFQDQHNRR
jgi:hypothetical protein